MLVYLPKINRINHTKMLKIKEYTAPQVEFLELVQEGTIMVQSNTGESYNPQDRYDGSWN